LAGLAIGLRILLTVFSVPLATDGGERAGGLPFPLLICSPSGLLLFSEEGGDGSHGPVPLHCPVCLLAGLVAVLGVLALVFALLAWSRWQVSAWPLALRPGTLRCCWRLSRGPPTLLPTAN